MDALNVIEAIRTRRSVRQFTDEPVNEETLRLLLACAMHAPSSENEQPWHFIVIRNKERLKEIARRDPYARMAAYAPLAIAICGDLATARSPGFWMLDCAAAMENLLLPPMELVWAVYGAACIRTNHFHVPLVNC